ncbi:MAG: phosphoribosylformylglycinamidine synthase subunit PurL [Planctomycetes bacterium]|nr:phosphoribosylformylglycinamidine synthase subunit PurL [Planctomycetota bacterium]
MARWTIDVFPLGSDLDPEGRSAVASATELGISTVRDVRCVRTYVVDLDEAVEEKARDEALTQLFADPVVQMAQLRGDGPAGDLKCAVPENRSADHVIWVLRRPGILDPLEGSVLKGLKDVGVTARAARVARRYLVWGKATPADLARLAKKALANEVIEEITIDALPPEPEGRDAGAAPPPASVAVRGLDDAALEEISRRAGLALTLHEMREVRSWFEGQGRDPTDVELDTIAQTWSEHCVHKTLTGKVSFQGVHIDNPLATYIKKVTHDLGKKWCVSVFHDNAGVIEYDNKFNLCFKVETHNHPSAIEPYGGAATGLGGVIRDILGTGLGARPILGLDVFCFAPPDTPEDRTPPGAVHPRRALREVVAGVRDYGNRVGLPTSVGALFFDERYAANPLVYCGCVGILPAGKEIKEPMENDLVVVMGGRTGRDGLGGATFSSRRLNDQSERLCAEAVQIGDAITEKRLIDALLTARDRELFNSLTDCGAGGLSSACGEMGQKLGVEIDLSRVPLKHQGLSAREIWLSEAQERMVLAVPEEKVQALFSIAAQEGVEATVIGRFTGGKRLRLTWDGKTVADLAMEFLFEGLPRITREATFQKPLIPVPRREEKKQYGDDLRRILAAWNVCSKEWIIRQYDHEVQGGSVIKPLVGVRSDGPGDGVVFTPIPGRRRGVAVGCGMNPRYGEIDPYFMAAAAVDEALRNVTAVGGNPEKTALLDNFCWGDTSRPENLGALMRALEGCHDAARDYQLPFISGKDSLNNEYMAGGKVISIPPSLLISAIALVPDIGRAASSDLKRAGNLIYLVGLTWDELGGSHFDLVNGLRSPDVPLFSGDNLHNFHALHQTIDKSHVAACHDLSEGGLAVALAEMCFAGGLGATVHLSDLPREIDLDDRAALFSESNARFLVEVAADQQEGFETLMDGTDFAPIGHVQAEPLLTIHGFSGAPVIAEPIAALKEAWQKPLRW